MRNAKQLGGGASAARRGFVVLALLLCSAAVRAETFRIELDYMVDGAPGGHSHQPSAQVLQAVVQMFACQGHTLIIDVSDAITHHDVLRLDNVNWTFFDYDGPADSFGALKNEWYDHAGVAGWHYCIFAHQYEWVDDLGNLFPSGSSGLAELGGDDLTVTLGTFIHENEPVGSPFEQAATLAHEFGHNLGLTHCGSLDCGGDTTTPDYVGPFVPNLPSIMTYMYQLQGVRTNLICQGLSPEFIPFKDLDYSHGTMCSLDEHGLVEPWGTMLRGVDWNCNGVIYGNHQENLSGGDESGWCAAFWGPETVLDDFDEWANITDATKTRSAAQLKNLPVETCVTSDQMLKNADKVVCDRPTLSVESCLTGETRYLKSDGSPGGRGSCEDPLDGVWGAVAGAPDGTAVIIEPGVWNEGPVLIREKVFLQAPYSAVIR